MGISESALIAEQNKILIQRSKEQGRPEYQTPVSPQELLSTQPDTLEETDLIHVIELQERESIRVLVNYARNHIAGQEVQDQEVANYFLSEIDEVQFTNPVYRDILEIFKNKLQEGQIIDGEYLIQNGTEEIKRTVVDLMTSKHEVSENWEKRFQIYVPKEEDQLKNVTYSNILRLKFRIVQHLIEEENKKLKNNLSDEELDEILDEISELKKIEVSLAGFLGNVVVK